MLVKEEISAAKPIKIKPLPILTKKEKQNNLANITSGSFILHTFVY